MLSGRLLLFPWALAAALVACSQPPPEPRFSLPAAARAWVPALPATHEPLSAALAFVASGASGGATWSPDRDDAFRAYVATLSLEGPSSHPELFPSSEDVLAYLVDAHLAWTLTLETSRELAGLGVEALRDAPIKVDGRPTSLRALAAEIAARAPWEPRLALFLNPGWRGGPPLPETAVEGRALDWQLSMHASRCGEAPGFWTLDPARKQLGASAYATLMWGLPADEPARTRRLLELVPPPRPVLDAVVRTCGAALQRCTVVQAPMDGARLLAP